MVIGDAAQTGRIAVALKTKKATRRSKPFKWLAGSVYSPRRPHHLFPL